MRVLPDKLYKYYGSLEYARLSIKKKGVFLDAPTNFNDPFDQTYKVLAFHGTKYKRWSLYYRIATFYLTSPNYICNHWGAIDFNETFERLLSEPTTDKNWLLYLEDAINDFISASKFDSIPAEEVFKGVTEQVHSGFENYQEKGNFYKVSCFSENNSSIPMWAYYGKSHTGVCIEYDLSLLDDNTKSMIQPVEYSDDRDFDSIYYKKSEAWKHEQEWRLIFEKPPKDLLYCPFDCITGIYFGCNFDFLDKSLLNVALHPTEEDNYKQKEGKFKLANHEHMKEYEKLIFAINNSARPIQMYRTSADVNNYQLHFSKF